jgi:hypothetical protein
MYNNYLLYYKRKQGWLAKDKFIDELIKAKYSDLQYKEVPIYVHFDMDWYIAFCKKCNTLAEIKSKTPLCYRELYDIVITKMHQW